MPENLIRVMCPNLRCRAVLAVPEDTRGRLVRCRNCGMNVKIPQKNESSPPPPPAGAAASATGQPSTAGAAPSAGAPVSAGKG